MRERLRAQLSQVLQTQETARGLIVNMSDVLFDTAKYTLKPEAREKLAKVSGILLAYPDLKVQVEGYTDNVGGDQYNLTLSQQRGDAVRAYLVSQGVSPDNITATGYGMSNPIADNSTAAGRAQNRRVNWWFRAMRSGCSKARRLRRRSATRHEQSTAVAFNPVERPGFPVRGAIPRLRVRLSVRQAA